METEDGQGGEEQPQTCRHCKHSWHDAGECLTFDCFCGYAACAFFASPEEWKQDARAEGK